MQLIVQNSEDEVQLYKIRQEYGYFRCPSKKCHFTWKATIGQAMDAPNCPKCGYEYV